MGTSAIESTKGLQLQEGLQGVGEESVEEYIESVTLLRHLNDPSQTAVHDVILRTNVEIYFKGLQG